MCTRGGQGGITGGRDFELVGCQCLGAPVPLGRLVAKGTGRWGGGGTAVGLHGSSAAGPSSEFLPYFFSRPPPTRSHPPRRRGQPWRLWASVISQW